MHLPELMDALKRKELIAAIGEYKHTTAEQNMLALHGPNTYALAAIPDRILGHPPQRRHCIHRRRSQIQRTQMDPNLHTWHP